MSPVCGLYDANEEAKADAVTLTVVDDDDEGVAEAKAEAKAEAVTLTIEDDDDDDDEGVAEAKDDDPLTRDDEAAIYRVKEEAAPEEPVPSVGDLARRFGDTVPTRPRRSTADDIEAERLRALYVIDALHGFISTERDGGPRPTVEAQHPRVRRMLIGERLIDRHVLRPLSVPIPHDAPREWRDRRGGL